MFDVFFQFQAPFIKFINFLKKKVYFSHACWKTTGLKNSSHLTGETLKNSRQNDVTWCGFLQGKQVEISLPYPLFRAQFLLRSCVFFFLPAMIPKLNL